MSCAPGSVVRFGARRAGGRAYLAIEGGFAVPSVLGSRATYARASMGGLDEPLAFGLQTLDAFLSAALALRLRFLKILRKQLEVQAKRAQVVLDFVNETTGEFC